MRTKQTGSVQLIVDRDAPTEYADGKHRHGDRQKILLNEFAQCAFVLRTKPAIELRLSAAEFGAARRRGLQRDGFATMAQFGIDVKMARARNGA